MSTQPHHYPSKSSLSITLTEPFVILRNDVGEFARSSILRGQLALDLSKVSKISSIQIELQGISHTPWAKGMSPGPSVQGLSFGPRTTAEHIQHKFFSATQVSFGAASLPSSRQFLSVEPGVSHHDGHYQLPPLPPPEAKLALPVPAPVHVAGDTSQRSRMRVRRRSSADNEEHNEFGDGWVEFRKGLSLKRSPLLPSNPQRIGTYTYPISFEIPSHMPASLECDSGSVVWRLEAKVRRLGVFTPNITVTRDVHFVCLPADEDVDMTREIQIERPWDDQLQYLFNVSRKSFAIGASFDVKMVFTPLAKVQMYKLAVDIEGKELFCIQ
jgi:hypothetical protein